MNHYRNIISLLGSLPGSRSRKASGLPRIWRGSAETETGTETGIGSEVGTGIAIGTGIGIETAGIVIGIETGIETATGTGTGSEIRRGRETGTAPGAFRARYPCSAPVFVYIFLFCFN